MKYVFFKYRHLILYGVFGVLTTVINIGVYWLFYSVIGISNVFSNILAWIFAVLFAFVTNKIWVFESKNRGIRFVFKELWKFMIARISTGLIDLLIMFVGVDVLSGPATLLKICANIIVIVMNYVLSKLFVFKKIEMN